MPLHKPSQAEEEYFAREELEKKRKLALSEAKAMAQAERERLRALHHMHCPSCGMQLHNIALRGVTASRCFSCHGVFLGEKALEKLIGHEGYWSTLISFFGAKDDVGDAADKSLDGNSSDTTTSSNVGDHTAGPKGGGAHG